MPLLIPPVVPPGTLSSVSQPDIVVGDLVLRAWRPADAAAVIRAFADPDIQHWHFRRYDTIAEAEAWISEANEAWRRETSASWAITRRSGGPAGDPVGGTVVGRAALSLVLKVACTNGKP